MPYFHVVFTLPRPVADIAYHNKSVVYDLLLKTAAETLITIAADPKHLGARIGLTAVLHTWGSALTHHPHAHIIVPGGGFSPKPAPAQAGGQHWTACRPRFFLSVEVLSRLFGRLFLERLTAAYQAGRLEFFADQAGLAEPARFKAYVAALRKVEWVVYAKRPFGGPGAVLAYLSRYTHRIAIANSRLVSLRRRARDVQMEGLPSQGRGSLQAHDARRQRVHPPLPDPRRRVPPHPSLRVVCQRQPGRQYRIGPSAPRRTRPSSVER